MPYFKMVRMGFICIFLNKYLSSWALLGLSKVNQFSLNSRLDLAVEMVVLNAEQLPMTIGFYLNQLAWTAQSGRRRLLLQMR